MFRRGLIYALALAALAIGLVILIATPSPGPSPTPTKPAPILAGGAHGGDASLRELERVVARRVERIRGLEFKRLPAIELDTHGQLIALARRLTASANRRAETSHPERLRRTRRLDRATAGFQRLAGLLPPGYTYATDATGALDGVSGAYNYRDGRIVLVPETIQTRIQLQYILAHELTHALESQHFHLHLAQITPPTEAAATHRALIEGTATYVQELYGHNYLDNPLGVKESIGGLGSLIAAGSGLYATKTSAVFEYSGGGLFVRSLVRRADGWREVNHALRAPPGRSTVILHPREWPGAPSAGHVALHVAPVLGKRWQLVGSAPAGEQTARAVLLVGLVGSEAVVGSSGWDGGRFAYWQRPGNDDCGTDCPGDEAAAVAFRWRGGGDSEQFRLATYGYMVTGLLGAPVGQRTWKFTDGYAALGTTRRASALAFAPSPRLANRLASLAARSAEGQ